MEDHEIPFDVYSKFKDAIRLGKRFKMPDLEDRFEQVCDQIEMDLPSPSSQRGF